MKVFITGGTGFIGRRVVEQLAARGYEVVCLVRSTPSAQRAVASGAIPVWGDVLDLTGLRAPMAGSDLVIHLAGLYRLGQPDRGQFISINVHGTRHVLETAAALGIPRIVYISSIAIFGDTHGRMVSEADCVPDGQPFVSPYDRSKWLADQEIVQPLVKRGAPIITVIPSAVYGPGDTSLVGQLMRAFLQGWLVLFPGPETRLSLTYIDDAVRGILQSADGGQPGERYILAGDTVTLKEACAQWVQLTGWPAPRAYVPARTIHRLEGLSRMLSGIAPNWPEILSPGAIRVLGVSYIGCAEKACRELGWRSRPLEDGFLETFDWLKSQPGIPGKKAANLRHTGIGLTGLIGIVMGSYLARRVIGRTMRSRSS